MRREPNSEGGRRYGKYCMRGRFASFPGVVDGRRAGVSGIRSGHGCVHEGQFSFNQASSACISATYFRSVSSEDAGSDDDRRPTMYRRTVDGCFDMHRANCPARSSKRGFMPKNEAARMTLIGPRPGLPSDDSRSMVAKPPNP